jgi:hypothetical protein
MTPSVFFSGTGRSLPIKSDMSVCSDRLIRINLWPAAFARANTRLSNQRIADIPEMLKGKTNKIPCIIDVDRHEYAAL